MNVTAAAHVPHHAHAPRRPATADTATTSGTGADIATTDDDAPEGPSRPGGSDTPWTHALHQGNGKKLGIHRRFADEIAAAQAAAGLGELAAGEETDAVEEPPVDGADGTAPTDGEAPPEDGTIALDGSSLGVTGTDEDGPTLLEELAEAVEEAVADAAAEDPVEELLAAATEDA